MERNKKARTQSEMQQAGPENSPQEHSLNSITVELDQEQTVHCYIQKKT